MITSCLSIGAVGTPLITPVVGSRLTPAGSDDAESKENSVMMFL